MSRPKGKNIFIFSLFSLILGAAAGAIVWATLKVMSLGIFALWEYIPRYVGHYKIYTLCICLAGGLIIGIFQKIVGIYPESLETVMRKLKTEGSYPYNNLHILIIGALLPLIFGGCLGPEAGLTGLIVGLCCFVGDRLKYKSAKVKELAGAGMAAVLGIVFNAPFFGIANNIENKSDDEDAFDKNELKRAKIVVYVAGVVGGFGAMLGLSHFFGGGLGISRITEFVSPTYKDWFFFIPLLVAGLLGGLLYVLVHKVTSTLGKKIEKHRIISCLVGGGCLAAMGIILPLTMFSGESQMADVMKSWQAIGAGLLIATAIGKIILVNLCIDLGWRGGNIFPVIFSGMCIGYAMAIITGINPVFAVAVTTSALSGYIMRKPLTTVAILFLCFPIRFVVPLALAAYIVSLIPVPFKPKNPTAKGD